MGDNHVRIWTRDRFQLLQSSLSRFGWWLHIYIRMEGRPECACSHFGPLAEIYRKAFYIIEDFFFSPLLWHIAESVSLWASSIFYAEKVVVCLCVCLCVYTHQSISVCISTSLYRYSVFSYAGVSIMYASGSLVFKCWRLTAHGDGLHHHLQHYAYYIRWRSAAEGPFPAFQGWGSCTHGPQRGTPWHAPRVASRTGLRAR